MRKLLIANKNEGNKKGFEVKELHKIVYMESFEGKTKAYYCEGKGNLIMKCLSQVEEKLPKEFFFKIHKSIIINIAFTTNRSIPIFLRYINCPYFHV
jgi:hypothetical protein